MADDAGRLAKLLDAGRGLVRHLDLETILDELLRVATELTGARYAAIGVLDERREALERFVTRGIEPAAHRRIGELPRGRGVLGELIRRPETLRLDDVGSHVASYGFPSEHPPMHTFLGTPIVLGDEAWGNLYLTEKQGGPFDEIDEDTAEVLAGWAGIAIENARLFRELARRSETIENSLRRLEATTAVARAVGSETDLDRVLELVVKRGRAIVDARAVAVFLVENGDSLHLAQAAGEIRNAEVGRRFPLAGTTTGEVLASGRTQRIRDVASRLKVQYGPLGVIGPRSALLAPMIYRDASLGVLCAFDRHGPETNFTLEDEQTLSAFAASAAIAVATAQTVAEERLRHSLASAELERRRWARELHDETLQGLAGLQMLLGSALRRDDAEQLERVVRQATELLGTEITNLRTLITELRPAALDELGLAPAIESLMQRVAAVEGFETQLQIDLPERLGPELETAVFRIVQEALSNIAKHARADRIEVAVRRQGPIVVAEVVDDGKGFDVGAPSEGFGLVGIRERVALAGGRLELTSRPGRTVLRAELPATAAAAA